MGYITRKFRAAFRRVQTFFTRRPHVSTKHKCGQKRIKVTVKESSVTGARKDTEYRNGRRKYERNEVNTVRPQKRNEQRHKIRPRGNKTERRYRVVSKRLATDVNDRPGPSTKPATTTGLTREHKTSTNLALVGRFDGEHSSKRPSRIIRSSVKARDEKDLQESTCLSDVRAKSGGSIARCVQSLPEVQEESQKYVASSSRRLEGLQRMSDVSMADSLQSSEVQKTGEGETGEQPVGSSVSPTDVREISEKTVTSGCRTDVVEVNDIPMSSTTVQNRERSVLLLLLLLLFLVQNFHR